MNYDEHNDTLDYTDKQRTMIKTENGQNGNASRLTMLNRSVI